MEGFSRKYFGKLDIVSLELGGPWNKNLSHTRKVEQSFALIEHLKQRNKGVSLGTSCKISVGVELAEDHFGKAPRVFLLGKQKRKEMHSKTES